MAYWRQLVISEGGGGNFWITKFSIQITPQCQFLATPFLIPNP